MWRSGYTRGLEMLTVNLDASNQLRQAKQLESMRTMRHWSEHGTWACSRPGLPPHPHLPAQR
jgi:hypothetical protein